MTLDMGLTVLIVVLRFFCFIAYGLLALGALIGLIHKQVSLEMKRVYAFLLMLMTAITYASLVVVYGWLQDLENWIIVTDPFNSLVLAIMFAAPGAFGLYIFKPWKMQ